MIVGLITKGFDKDGYMLVILYKNIKNDNNYKHEISINHTLSIKNDDIDNYIEHLDEFI